jgi:hypothetical protein
MANYDRLIAAGVLFPRTGFKKSDVLQTVTSGHQGLIPFMRQTSGNVDDPRGIELREEIEKHDCPRIIVSSEVLSAPHSQNAVNGVKWFRSLGFEVKIVVYLRRQDEWLDSFYRERLKWMGRHAETRTLEEFVEQEGDVWLDYENRIGCWLESVGGVADAIIRSYDDVQACGGVVSDFLTTVEVATEMLDLSIAGMEHNPSLPPSLAAFFLALNQIPAVSAGAKARLLSVLPHTDMGRRSTGTLISAAMWERLAATYGARNEDLRKRWLSGPSDKLSFQTGSPRQGSVEPAISFDDSMRLLSGLLQT